jgi:hypothetical protein
MKRQFRQAWKRAHWEEAQIRSRPTRGYVHPSDVKKARLVWQEAQILKSKPLTDPQAEKLGKALRSAVRWYQTAAEPRPPREKEQLEKIKRTAEKLVRLLASSSKTRVRLKREFPLVAGRYQWATDHQVLGAVSVIRKAAARALVTCDNTTGEKVSRRRAGAILEEKFGSPGRLFVRRVAKAYLEVTGKSKVGVTFNAHTNVIEGPFVRFAQESARRFGVPAPDGETIKEAVKDLKSLKGTRENLSVAGPLSRAATMVKKGPSQPSPDGLK